MNRRQLLQSAAVLPVATALSPFGFAWAAAGAEGMARVRPADPGWPSQALWD